MAPALIGRRAVIPLSESWPTLPDDCRVRLIDLDTRVGGLIAIGEDGFVNIYLNARLSHDAQLRALEHELRHFHRDDLYSERDIREVEQAAEHPDAPPLLSIEGKPLKHSPAGFDPLMLRPLGRGLYWPLGRNLDRVSSDIDCAAAGLHEALRFFDILQSPPLVPLERLHALARGLGSEDIAFLAWHASAPEAAPTAILTLFRDADDRMDCSLYYDAEGCLHNALIHLSISSEPVSRIAVDLRKQRGGLSPHAITREINGGNPERLF